MTHKLASTGQRVWVIGSESGDRSLCLLPLGQKTRAGNLGATQVIHNSKLTKLKATDGE